MDKQKKARISRRRQLAGGAIAAPTLALVHETIPHRGVHNALDGEAAAAGIGALDLTGLLVGV